MKYDIKCIGIKHLDWVGILLTTDLHSAAKYLALYLSRFMNRENDMAWPSLTRIKNDTGLSKATVCRYLKVLEDEQWLTRKKGNSNTNTVYIISYPDDFANMFNNVQGSLTQRLGVVSDRDRGSVSVRLGVVSHRDPNNKSNSQLNRQKDKTTLSGEPDDSKIRNISNSTSKVTKTDTYEVLDFLNNLTGHDYQKVEANVSLIGKRLTEALKTFGDIESATLLARRICIDRNQKWGTDEKMSEYLRPATLFSKTNFWNYAGQLPDRLKIKHKGAQNV